MQSWPCLEYLSITDDEWKKAKKKIYERVQLIDIISVYKIYYEMDISQFIDTLNPKINSVILDTKLKKIREASGLSQDDLAKVSYVSLRSIQLYEQRVNDMDKA